MGLQKFLRDPYRHQPPPTPARCLLSFTAAFFGPSLMSEVASELLITRQEGADDAPPLYGLIMEVRVNKHG